MCICKLLIWAQDGWKLSCFISLSLLSSWCGVCFRLTVVRIIASFRNNNFIFIIAKRSRLLLENKLVPLCGKKWMRSHFFMSSHAPDPKYMLMNCSASRYRLDRQFIRSHFNETPEWGEIAADWGTICHYVQSKLQSFCCIGRKARHILPNILLSRFRP